MELYDAVIKLVGPIEPIGETNADTQRLENLKQLCELVDRLIFDIDMVGRNKGRVEYSIRRAGEVADSFLTELGINE